MARYDKYDPESGGFRSALAVDFETADLNVLLGVGQNATGETVKGGGNSGVIGVLVLTKAHKAGHVIDVMTQGEVIEFGGTPGTVYWADPATGAINSTRGAGKVRVGHTVEGGRLIVRVVPEPVAA